jgi:hypothetical protein
VRAAAHKAALTARFVPTNTYESFLIGEISLSAAKIEYGEELLGVAQERAAERARTHWQFEARSRARQLCQRYSRDPARVTAALLKEPQGVAALLDFWDQLAGILQNTGTWTDGQRRMALEMIRVPHALREGSARVPEDADTETLAGIVAEQTALLGGLLETLERIDADDQKLAAGGFPVVEDATTRRIKRGLAEARRDWRRAREELTRIREGAEPNERLAGQSGPAPPAEATPGAKPPSEPTAEPAEPASRFSAEVERRFAERAAQDLREFLQAELNRTIQTSSEPAVPAADASPPPAQAERRPPTGAFRQVPQQGKGKRRRRKGR